MRNFIDWGPTSGCALAGTGRTSLYEINECWFSDKYEQTGRWWRRKGEMMINGPQADFHSSLTHGQVHPLLFP